ncbi:3-phosphoshikimate 1-carboxyvinyltransferase [Friedmanniella endophytica]|uniref:3-phosphoshikimate 1-carboxyvinyltransferase n=1 Tax=Microlunatus kandeliicorticis TaxID=1759536 RepID=A0A7W3P743_9ACTN|nr:3-phosphoshikimate 1-carboxyvinyltransferase [Microlunatus kandeliicorticis]MBA8795597.1 3-phosphoshikimate 1-carboxyvinyltransferase [Microlunatus kandeliicorticis]
MTEPTATTQTSSEPGVGPQPWAAPIATVPVRATVRVPGSKSETARALVLAALADRPSTITNGLDARDTRLMRDGLRALGVRIDDGDGHDAPVWTVTPPERFTAGATIDCGLAGTVMRFLPPLAALAEGRTSFDGDEAARVRPMAGLFDGLADAGAHVEPIGEGNRGGLPFAVTGRPDLPGGVITIDASASSQFVSGLLMIGARLAGGLDLRHVSQTGAAVPSAPNIAMTVAHLRERGVQVDDSRPDHWIVSPGPVAARDVTIGPDLANAAPFLAAAAVTGGRVTVPDWPERTDQPGDRIQEVLALFGAEVALDADGLTVTGTDQLHAVDLDLSDASELTPVVAVLAALADHTSHLHGVAHIRGHETDRLAALATDLEAVGAGVRETDDGLTVHPKLLRSSGWLTYADHRMAHAGAVLGLVIDDIVLDDIGCVGKTMPEFPVLWQRMLDDAVRADEELSAS